MAHSCQAEAGGRVTGNPLKMGRQTKKKVKCLHERVQVLVSAVNSDACWVQITQVTCNV